MTERAGKARSAAHAALVDFERGAVARIRPVLDRGRLDARDRALANEIAHGVVRRSRLLDYILTPLAPRGLPPDPRALCALRLGAYQLLFLSRVPPHAAVNESVALAGRRASGFVNAVLRRLGRMTADRPAEAARPAAEVSLGEGRCLILEQALPDPATDPAEHTAILNGLPTFVVRGWEEAYGIERARAIAEASVRPPGVHLRATAACGSDPEALARVLRLEGVETGPSEHPAGLFWIAGAAPFGGEAFRDGLFVVQDVTAIRAAEALDAQPGEAILDLCAAPGTKAALLAERVGPEGCVFAFDVDVERRGAIRENVERLGLPQLRVIDDPDSCDRPIDRVLVDVPCTNTGVLARRVEVRHRLRPADIARFAATQRTVLRRAFELLRPDAPEGVQVLYSTCSVEPRENLDVVEAVAGEVGANVLSAETTLPEPPRHDGGFQAALSRRDANGGPADSTRG